MRCGRCGSMLPACGSVRLPEPGTDLDSVVACNVSAGAVVGDATCQQALGAVAADMLTAPCGTKSCKLYTWKVCNNSGFAPGTHHVFIVSVFGQPHGSTLQSSVSAQICG